MSKQKLGAILLIPAFFLSLIKETGIAFVILIGIGAYDIYLSVTAQQTITQWFRMWCPRPVGFGIAITLIVVGHIFGRHPKEERWQFLLWAVMYCVIGHLFWQ